MHLEILDFEVETGSVVAVLGNAGVARESTVDGRRDRDRVPRQSRRSTGETFWAN